MLANRNHPNIVGIFDFGESDTAKPALSELCETSYEPMHTFIRHMTGDDSTRDLTHAFFEAFLKRDALSKSERGQGKFCSYLQGGLKHFIFDQRDRSRTDKRGGRCKRTLVG